MFFQTSPSNRQYKEPKQKKQDERGSPGRTIKCGEYAQKSIPGMAPNQSESACSLVLKSIKKGESAEKFLERGSGSVSNP